MEEWICYCFGIQLGADKPFKALSDKCKEKMGSKDGYKKWQLPRFVENLDISALRRNCYSFEAFVNDKVLMLFITEAGILYAMDSVEVREYNS